MSEPVRLVVGRIGRAHGIRGDVSVEVRTDDPDARFAPGVTLLTEPAERGPLTVASGRMHSGRLLLSFEGVADRSAAEALANTLLVVDVDPDARPEDPEEFYDHQLVGLAVRTVGGEQVGEVSEVLHLPAQDVLSVRRGDGREVLVPFVAAIVPEVDLDAGRVVVDPPAGLLDADTDTEADDHADTPSDADADRRADAPG
jgi:16S rRNA processing protein RimM